MQYNFEWDPSKAKENLRKHKVSFERASQVFLDPYMLSIEDEEHSEEEDRWLTAGMDKMDYCSSFTILFRRLTQTTLILE